MVHEVAGEEQRLAARIDHEARVSDRVSGHVHRLHAGQDFLAVLVEDDAFAVRQQVLLRGQGGVFPRRAHPLFVGPEFQVELGNVDLRVRVIAAAVLRHDAADMVDMRVRGDDRVDVRGIDARQLEVGREPPHQRGALHRAHACLEHGELVAGIDHQHVLVQHHVVGGQEMIGHHLAELVRGRAAEGIFWIADRKRSVGHHRRLDASELEAIERRRLRVEHRRLGHGGRGAAEKADRRRRRGCGQQPSA